MGNSVQYGLEDYARDRYGVGAASDGVFHREEPTTRPPVRAVSELSRVTVRTGNGARILTADELVLMRRLEGMSTAREHLAKVLNQPCRYDETATPLYGILQKQYDRETARAVGKAYIAAASHVGGGEYSVTAETKASLDGQNENGFGERQAELNAARDVLGYGRSSVTGWYTAARQVGETDRKEKKDV